VHRLLKRYDQADQAYRAKLEFEPESAWNWGNYASFQLFYHRNVDGAIASGRHALQLMQYGAAQRDLACALFTKWAMLLQDEASRVEAQAYFDEAWALFPYPKQVIERTKKRKYTRIAALELRKWLAAQDGSRSI
jgi:tetratricopeptide (TPR) repeat protein